MSRVKKNGEVKIGGERVAFSGRRDTNGSPKRRAAVWGASSTKRQLDGKKKDPRAPGRTYKLHEEICGKNLAV